MSLINVNNLTFAYDGSYDNVFENVSFAVDTDWRLGLTGRNGRGKTTLMRLLAGELTYSGSINASVEFEYFPYKVADEEYLTIDIVRDIAPLAEDWEITRELSFLGADSDILYRQFKTLSHGERTKTLLAAMFLKENSFLLIDEPTNHLDAEGRSLLAQYLKRKKGFILVSHDRAFLDGCIDHILAINRSGIEVQRGNFSSWYRNKELRDGFEEAQNERLKKDINRLDAAAKRTSSWSSKTEKSKHSDGTPGFFDRGYIGHKSAKMMKRSKSIEQRRLDLIEEKSGLLKDIEKSETLAVFPLAYHSKRLVTLRDVSLMYGGRTVCDGINLSVDAGDRIAVRGANGSGKSTLLKLIAGRDITHTGVFETGAGVKISYADQSAQSLSGSLDAYADSFGIDITQFMTILRKLGFSREQFKKDMSDWSGGQKKKAVIARSLCERAHLYVWDEPMNYIDVISRIQIEELIKKCAPTIIFVEHDAAFAENIATKTYNL